MVVVVEEEEREEEEEEEEEERKGWGRLAPALSLCADVARGQCWCWVPAW